MLDADASAALIRPFQSASTLCPPGGIRPPVGQQLARILRAELVLLRPQLKRPEAMSMLWPPNSCPANIIDRVEEGASSDLELLYLRRDPD